jgi:hypothetical protein
LDQRQTQRKPRVRFECVDDESKREIRDHEQPEAIAGSREGGRLSGKEDGEHRKKRDLVELRRMAGDAVTEVDAHPGCGGCSERAVVQTCQETADAADRDADRERQREEIAGSLGDQRVWPETTSPWCLRCHQ